MIEHPKNKNDDKELTLEERAVKYVLDSKKESLTYYEKKFQKFAYFDKLYIQGASKTNVPQGRANLRLPLVFQQIEPFVSQMTESMIGEAPYIKYIGRGPEDEIPAEQITDFTQYQLECGGFVPAYNSYVRNLGKYGTGVMKLIWDTEYQTVKDIQVEQSFELDEESKAIVPVEIEREVETEIKTFDGLRFINVSLFDFFVPKSAVSCNVQKMEFAIHRTYRLIDELLQNPNYAKGHKKLKKLEYSSEDNKEFSAEDYKRAELEKNNPKGLQKFSGKCEVLEAWCKFKWDDKPGEPHKPTLIVVALVEGEEILLRLEENPYKYKFIPFIMSNDYPIDGEPYGYGEVDHIEGLVEESTALRNARLDVANISLNRVWLVERQSGVNLRELYTAPNKIILTNDLNGIRALDMAGVTASSVEELGRIDYDIQNTTEILNPRQDAAQSGAAFGGTATGVDFLTSRASMRMMSKARLQEETFFKPLAMMANQFNQELVTEEMYYRVANDKAPYRTISPDAFLTQVDFKPVSAPEKLSAMQRKENIGFLFQTAGQIEKSAPGTNNFQELLPELYKAAGFSNPERFINPKITQVFQTPDGMLVDAKGQQVQVMPAEQLMQNGQQPPQ